MLTVIRSLRTDLELKLSMTSLAEEKSPTLVILFVLLWSPDFFLFFFPALRGS